MATTKPFQLFPAPPPKISIPKPYHKRQPSIPKTIVEPIETTLKSENGQSVIIKIEETGTRPMSAGIGLARSTGPEIFSEDIVVPASPIDGLSRIATPEFLPPPPPRRTPRQQIDSAGPENTSDKQTPSRPQSVRSESSTLVRNSSQSSHAQSSPVAPMRSMFPVYNPSIPLSQQPYFPQRSTSLQPRFVSRDEYASRVATPSLSDHVVGGPKTAPASIINFPADVFNSSEPQFSSQKELETLWDASHGMEANAAVRSFDLEMARMNEATFTFGANPVIPFYTLTTYNTHEISISKTSPRKKTAKCEIIQSSLEDPARRLSPNDGLVTLIFPRLAAMLAIDQSTELANQHSLAPTHRDEVLAAAVERAAAQEACKLFWRENEQRYELEHPAIGRDPRNPEFANSPISPQDGSKPVLHITVSSLGMSSSTPPVILVTNPLALSSPSSSAGAGIRMSAMPQPDTDHPLASLNFGTMTLHIDVYQILSQMPSLFAIDSIVSALLAVAVSDPVTNPVMATMDIWSSRTTTILTNTPKPPGSVFGGSVKSYAGSTFFATIAEREEAEEEAKLMKLVHDKDLRNKNKPEKKKKGWFGNKKEEEDLELGKKSKKIVVKEFDLEKLGRYQAGTRKGEELPGVTRGVLEVLVGGLRLIVWMLTLVVEFLVWILVAGSRAMTSEKF